MLESDTPWTTDDVPPGPYFHGTRHSIVAGDTLITDEVDPTGGDLRQRAYATTDMSSALQWARQRQVHVGDTLFVYEVEVIQPEVDVNMHRRGMPENVTSVMAEVIRVVRIAHQEQFDGIIFPKS